MTDGKAPGLVRYYLACDSMSCATRAVFDLVIETPPPPVEEDFIAHFTHNGAQAADFLEERGWHFIRTFGYFCPSCSTPRSQRPPSPAPARRTDPHRRPRRAPKRP